LVEEVHLFRTRKLNFFCITLIGDFALVGAFLKAQFPLSRATVDHE